ncbi:MAG: hypothetical protein NVSMB13_01910 [Mycobacteriales bacterium]
MLSTLGLFAIVVVRGFGDAGAVVLRDGRDDRRNDRHDDRDRRNDRYGRLGGLGLLRLRGLGLLRLRASVSCGSAVAVAVAVTSGVVSAVELATLCRATVPPPRTRPAVRTAASLAFAASSAGRESNMEASGTG